MSRAITSLIIFAGFNIFIYGSQQLQLIPERTELHFVNSSYARDVILNVRRQYRRGPYVGNIGGILLQTLGNNVSMHIILYEYLHNEYKRSFVEFHFQRLCDTFNTENYIGKTLIRAGVPCPLPPGNYTFSNISLNWDNFPYVWPFERAKSVVHLISTPNSDVIANYSIYLTFKQKTKN